MQLINAIEEGSNMSFIAKLLTKGANKVLSKADKKKLADEAKKAADLKKNQKKPANTLQSKSKTEQKESGMGTSSSARTMLAEIGGKTSKQKKAYNAKVKQYNEMKDKTTEKAQLLKNSINDMKKRLGFSKGGSATKKVPVISIGVGMAEMPKGKAKMMRGGMSGGKEHMYAAGGMVKDNPGLKALKAANPMAYNKITGK